MLADLWSAGCSLTIRAAVEVANHENDSVLGDAGDRVIEGDVVSCDLCIEPEVEE